MPDPFQQKQFWDQYKGAIYNASEIEFYEDITSEIFGIYGIPCEWYPVEIDVEDPQKRIFGEDPTKKFIKKYLVTALIEGDSVQENVIFNNFGMLHKIEFTIHLHIKTFVETVGRKPIIGDQFSFMNNLSQHVFEATHVTESSLGVKGNYFGHRTVYTVNCREREISAPEIGDGERYGHVDSEGNVLPNSPPDLLTPGGEIREKYKIPGLTKKKRKYSYASDNKEIQEVADGVDENGVVKLPGGRGIISRSGKLKPDWGNW
ncbi:MAG: hypothetical protein NZZ41_01140 [Candidatus Dojkabacteria bacterium]|nr:hypothetical protein [Candidatus Dojkabacteria bacterium]